MPVGVGGFALDCILLDSYTLLMYHVSFLFDSFSQSEAVAAFAKLTYHYSLIVYRLF